MPEIKLFIATSLDGFIAREDGSLDWLYALPNPNKTDHGYSAFLDGIDTIMLGRKTYEEILGFGLEWPYKGINSYVVTSNREYYCCQTPDTKVLNFISQETVKTLRSDSKKGIWVVGGGKLITALLNLRQMDEMILSVIPVILGKGIRLFPDSPLETQFDLITSEAFETGVVNLTYRKKS